MDLSSLRYHSGLSEKQKQRSATAPDRRFLPLEFAHGSPEIFRIRFATESYAPNHRVTLRTELSGWTRDIHGLYRDGAWIFSLPKSEYDRRLEFKFYLDGNMWMEGANLVV